MTSNKDFLEILSSSKINIKQLEYSFLPTQEPEAPCGFKALWRAVITQALMDAGSNSAKGEFKKEKARAISWLHSDSEDFKEVCSLADLDPTYVRRKAKEALKNGCKWRMEKNVFKQQAMEIERKVIYVENFLSSKRLLAG